MSPYFKFFLAALAVGAVVAAAALAIGADLFFTGYAWGLR